MVKQYVGARYVPKFANPVEWAADTSYEALTIVTFNNASYTSKIQVPPTVGNPANNPQYWALTGNYNAQVEQYRQETENLKIITENYNAQVEQYRQETEDVKINYSKCFNTAANMIADASLTEGMIVKTLGYNKIDDNGGAFYKIYNTKEQNSEHYENLSNGKYALLVPNGYITPEMFGASGDGVTDDTVSIQNCIDAAMSNGRTIKCYSGKTYLITSAININNRLNIDINKSIILCTSDTAFNITMPSIIDYTETEKNIFNMNVKYTGTSGGTIGFNIINGNFTEFTGSINNFETAIKITGGAECSFKNISIVGNNSANCYGIYCTTSDLFFEDIIMKDCTVGFLNSGTNTLINYHPWLSKAFNNSIGLKHTGGVLLCVNYIADSYQYAVSKSNLSKLSLINFRSIFNTDYYTGDYNAPVIFHTEEDVIGSNVYQYSEVIGSAINGITNTSLSNEIPLLMPFYGCSFTNIDTSQITNLNNYQLTTDLDYDYNIVSVKDNVATTCIALKTDVNFDNGIHIGTFTKKPRYNTAIIGLLSNSASPLTSLVEPCNITIDTKGDAVCRRIGTESAKQYKYLYIFGNYICREF